jgi:hypothetical protein
MSPITLAVRKPAAEDDDPRRGATSWREPAMRRRGAGVALRNWVPSGLVGPWLFGCGRVVVAVLPGQGEVGVCPAGGTTVESECVRDEGSVRSDWFL